ETLTSLRSVRINLCVSEGVLLFVEANRGGAFFRCVSHQFRFLPRGTETLREASWQAEQSRQVLNLAIVWESPKDGFELKIAKHWTKRGCSQQSAPLSLKRLRACTRGKCSCGDEARTALHTHAIKYSHARSNAILDAHALATI